MPLVNVKDLLQHAYNNRYAVGAFEVVSLDFLRAVIDAAEKARSPVILNIVETHRQLYDPQTLMSAVMHAAKRATVPLAVNMDHCSSLESAQSAIRLGCNSIMFDAAHESFPVNTRRTSEVVEMAHTCGVAVEGEVGYVAGNGNDAENNGEATSTYTTLDEARAYVERTGVDFLAISVGTVHGRTKNKFRLDFTRLARINDALQMPLVIHGGTGLSDDQVQKLIGHGVARINYFTGLAESAVQQIQANLKSDAINYQQLMANVSDTIASEVQRCMQVWGSAGRAAEVLMQCRPWRNVEQAIVFNPVNSDEPDVINYILNKAKQELEQIPGVMSVRTGKTLDEKGAPRHCLFTRLASEEVVSQFKKHPVFMANTENFARYLEGYTTVGEFQLLDEPSATATAPFLIESATPQPTVVEFKTN